MNYMRMSADTIVKIAQKKANQMVKDGWTWDKYREISDLISDWNRAHESAGIEIFMCDYQSEDSDHVNGFMIEDDYWVFEDM